MKRTILHCDLNCFFASVEMLYNPELRDVPMAIAGDKESRHGIILAKNVLAKKAGVNIAAVNLSWNGSTAYSFPEILDKVITGTPI